MSCRQTKFTSQDHTHSRPDAKKSEEKSDVYDYSLQLCTPVGSDAAVLQNDKTAKTDVLLGKSTSSFALGGSECLHFSLRGPLHEKFAEAYTERTIIRRKN